jgi:hypothetical protein
MLSLCASRGNLVTTVEIPLAKCNNGTNNIKHQQTNIPISLAVLLV